MSDLIFTHVRKEFPGGVVAVEDFSLVVPNPRMLVSRYLQDRARLLGETRTPADALCYSDARRLEFQGTMTADSAHG